MSKVVVITGGSKGIGKELAKLYASSGDHVIIIARNKESIDLALTEIKSCASTGIQKFEGLQADVSNQSQVTSVIKKVQKDFNQIDILITCAGFSKPGYFDNQTTEIFRETMDVNFYGTLYTIKAVEPEMKSKKTGQICIIASGAALIGIFGTSAYCTSKYALRGLADSLRSEFLLNGINLSIAYLPDTDTPLSRKVAKFKPYETQLIMGTGGFYSAKSVAKRIYNGIGKRKFNIIKGSAIYILFHFGSLLMPLTQWYFYRKIKKYKDSQKN